jgi:CBS domain-containing protein
VDELMLKQVVVGYPDMTLRELANLMAERQVSSVPIVDRNNKLQVVCVMSIEQVLEARLRDVNEERKPERVLNWLQIRAVRGDRIIVHSQPGGKSGSDADAG